MAETEFNVTGFEEATFDRIALALHTVGYCVIANSLPLALGEALCARVLLVTGEFKRAGVGRGMVPNADGLIRTDGIRWLSRDDGTETAYLAWMERLRLGLNRRLFLGLFDYESHFAIYEAGGSYRIHLDAFQGETNRIVSTVFYLNPRWLPASCGELLIHGSDGILLESVMPDIGTMVIFLSAQFPHQVAITHRKRYSIAGWFSGR